MGQAPRANHFSRAVDRPYRPAAKAAGLQERNNKMGQSHPQVIQILSLLRSNELDVNKARNFDFNLYFPNEAAAQAAAERLVTEGFTAEVSPATEDRFPWRCAASHRLVPTD